MTEVLLWPPIIYSSAWVEQIFWSEVLWSLISLHFMVGIAMNHNFRIALSWLFFLQKVWLNFLNIIFDYIWQYFHLVLFFCLNFLPNIWLYLTIFSAPHLSLPLFKLCSQLFCPGCLLYEKKIKINKRKRRRGREKEVSKNETTKRRATVQ